MKKLLKLNQSVYIFLRNLKMLILRKRYGLRKVSKSFYMAGKSSISKDLLAGDYSYIGNNCNIYPKVRIGRFTMLADNVFIVGGDHNYSDPHNPMIFSGRPELPETVIGEDVWIGTCSIILAGLTIGDGAIVGAGSVVTKDIPPYSIYAGVPAKFIKMRFNKEEIMIHKEMLKRDFVNINYCKNLLD